MAPTSKDGSRRGNCPLLGGEAVRRRGAWAHCKCVRERERRASSVPAAAVIPTPRVSAVDAAVKTSVVWAAAKARWSEACVLQRMAGRTGGAVCAGER